MLSKFIADFNESNPARKITDAEKRVLEVFAEWQAERGLCREWKSLDQEMPENGAEHPIMVVAMHSGKTFKEWGQWVDGRWLVRGRPMQHYGWIFIAWFNLPDLPIG